MTKQMLGKWVLLAGIIAAAFAANVSRAAGVSPSAGEVTVSISDAYVPSGFDSSTDVFLVVSGLFPNTCYEWKEARVNHLSETRHEVRAIARVRPGMCMMVLVPYNREVHLGKLSRGEHTLRFVGGDGTYLEKKIDID